MLRVAFGKFQSTIGRPEDQAVARQEPQSFYYVYQFFYCHIVSIIYQYYSIIDNWRNLNVLILFEGRNECIISVISFWVISVIKEKI